MDFSSAFLMRTKLQAATDATVLALAGQLNQTPSQLTQTGNALLQSMDLGAAASLTGAPVVSQNGTEVCIQTASSSPTRFSKLASMTVFQVASSACAQTSQGRLELALVLDNSGSMNDSTTGGVSKISALKSAAAKFVSSVFAAHPGSGGQLPPVQMSVVPFQDAVALSSSDTDNGRASWIDSQGQSSWHWKGWYGPNDPQSGLPPGVNVKSKFDVFNWLTSAGGSQYAWRGCFESLPYPLNTQDATPNLSAPDSLFVPSFAPDEPDNFDDSNGSVNNYLRDYSSSCTSRPTNAAQRQERICKYQRPLLTGSRNSWNNPNYSCNSQPLLRLTDNQSAINSEISQLAAAGATNLNEGVMWGWRTISRTARCAMARPMG